MRATDATHMEIVVDTNAGEDALFETLSVAHPEVTRRERLDVGDVWLRANGDTVIIERKKTADLASSLSDGRYREQKARQLAAVAEDETGKTRVVWLVEGQLMPMSVTLAGGTTVRSIECAILKTVVRDGIPVIRVGDAPALAEMVQHLFNMLKNGEMDAEAVLQKRMADGYAGAVCVKKSKNSDPLLTWKMMLATVHGLSMTKATSLVERWPSPHALAAEIAGLDRKKAVKVVAAIKTNGRNLGPAVAGRLVDVFQR